MKAPFDILICCSVLSEFSCEMYFILSRIVPGMGASSVKWSSVSPAVVMSTSRVKSPAGERDRDNDKVQWCLKAGILLAWMVTQMPIQCIKQLPVCFCIWADSWCHPLPKTDKEVEVEAVKVTAVCEFSMKTVTMAMHVIVPLSALPSWFIVSILVAVWFLVIMYFPLRVLPSWVRFTPLCIHERVSPGPPLAAQESITSLPSITTVLDCRCVWIVGLSEEMSD